MTGMPGQSLRDELSAGLEGGEAPELNTAVEGAPPGAPPAIEAPPIPEELPALEAPTVWNKPYRDAFGKFAANPEYRDLLTNWKDQWKEQEGVLTKKSQEYADYKRGIDPIMQVIAPYEQYWAQQGLDRTAGVRQIFSYAEALARDPSATLLQLADMYGVNLQEALQAAPYVDPEVAALKQQLAEMRQMQEQWGTSQQEAQRNRVVSEIQQFAEAKGADGTPLHPYFDRVLDKMTGLAQGKLAPDLATAYEMAVRLDPDIQAELSQLTQQKEAAERAALAKKAVGASQTVQSKSTEVVPAGKSLRDELAEGFAGLGYQ